jgi:hypothetical protein
MFIVQYPLLTLSRPFSLSPDSSVGIAVGYGLDGRGDVVETGSGAHPASYPMGTGGGFPTDKADEA